MIKVNDIFLPNDQVELETQDLKKWLKYCKLQDKRFKTVVDTVGEYGIWSRSMRLYSKIIKSHQTDRQMQPVWTKNCERYSNIDFYQTAFDFSVSDPVDCIRLDAEGLKSFLESQIETKFIYMDNFQDYEINGYRVIIDGERDKIFHKQ